MKPLVIRVDPLKIDLEKIKKAAGVIIKGGLVAFPTETVYGLGAAALDERAVAGIFSAKKRPLDDPLIVHIAENSGLKELVKVVPDKAKNLMEKFWPGPLTLVLKKRETVPDIVTTGLDTVAVRMPSGKIALKLIELSGTPIAAPSANLFGRPSPTSADHVEEDLGESVDVIIDGGDTDIGIESTVVAFSEDEVFILRPGGVTLEEIESVIGRVSICPPDNSLSASPGKYPRHYSPEAKVVLVEKGPGQKERVIREAQDNIGKGRKTGIMCFAGNVPAYQGFDVKELGPLEDARLSASRLFRIFREFDREGYDVIVAEGTEEEGLWAAIMNRIRKASAGS